MRVPQIDMIGRKPEREIIDKAFKRTLESQGQILLINGEAGIGKSTLTDYLDNIATESGIPICKGECTIQDAGIPYQGFQRALCDIAEDALFSLEDFAYFDEVFLISKIGLLISHISRSKDEGIDEDILGSMLTAVQDFVKDSFGDGEAEEQKGGLGKLEYLNTKITIEHGDLVYLAVVTSGDEHPDMKKDIKKCLNNIEETYFDLLMDWDGDLDSLSGSIGIIEGLVEKKYRVKRSLENINLEVERLKVQNRIHEILESNASEKGLLLILEDIHWADESTILALPFLARNLIEQKIIMCLTYRSENLEEGNLPLKQVIDTILDGVGSECISLTHLDKGSQDKLVSNLLDGGNPPEELMENLRAESDGNPFFVIEAVRALVADGTLYKDKDVWVLKHGSKSVIPHTVTELVSRRLETLELDSLRFVEYGAVLGRRFGADLLASGFRMSQEHVDETIQQLVNANIFNKVGSNEVMFQHSKIQEVIYSGMSERWKRMLHRDAGNTIEAANRDNIEEVLFSLAYHFSRTLKYEKGIDYSISAGYKARNNFAPREAAQFFEKAIELIDISEKEEDTYLELNEELGELYELDGNYDKALSIFDKLLEISDDQYHRSTVFMMKGRVLQSQSNYDDAIAAYEEGIALAEAMDSSLLKAKINGYLGKIYLRKGEYEKALELQRTYLNESQKVGENREIGQAYMNLGGVFLHLNDNHMAVQNWEISLTFFKNARYEQGIAYVNDNLGVAHLWSGNYETALKYCQNSLAIMTKIGDVKGISSVYLNIGVLYNRMGQYDKSLEFNRKSLQIKHKIGDSVGVANIYNNIGENFQNMGRYEESIQNFQLNLEIMEKCGDIWGVGRVLSNIAEPELELGKIDEARKHCQRSIDIAEKHSFKDILSYSYMLMGTISCLDGDTDAADKYFVDSLSFAEEIEDPERIGGAYLSIARSLMRRDEEEKAIDNYAEAFKIFEDAKMEALARRTREEMQNIIDDN